MAYLAELERWNRRINLTGSRGAQEVVVAHFLDSLAGLTALAPPLAEPGRVPIRTVDIGTGAGFPGLPLKLYCPSWTVTLIEATKKKAAFLHHLVALLGLTGVEVVAERAEQVGLDPRHAGAYDLALVRALGPTDLAAGLARPLLGARGRLLLYRGSWSSSGPQATTGPGGLPPGYRLEATRWLTLPFTGAQRTLLLYCSNQPEMFHVEHFSPFPAWRGVG